MRAWPETALGQWPHCGAGPCVPVWCEPVTPRVEAGGTPPTFQRSCLAIPPFPNLSLLALLLSCYLLPAGEEGPAVGCPACWLLGCLRARLAALANPVSGTPSPTATTTSILPPPLHFPVYPTRLTPLSHHYYYIHHNIHHHNAYHWCIMCSRHLPQTHLM